MKLWDKIKNGFRDTRSDKQTGRQTIGKADQDKRLLGGPVKIITPQEVDEEKIKDFKNRIKVLVEPFEL